MDRVKAANQFADFLLKSNKLKRGQSQARFFLSPQKLGLVPLLLLKPLVAFANGFVSLLHEPALLNLIAYHLVKVAFRFAQIQNLLSGNYFQ